MAKRTTLNEQEQNGLEILKKVFKPLGYEVGVLLAEYNSNYNQVYIYPIGTPQNTISIEEVKKVIKITQPVQDKKIGLDMVGTLNSIQVSRDGYPSDFKYTISRVPNGENDEKWIITKYKNPSHIRTSAENCLKQTIELHTVDKNSKDFKDYYRLSIKNTSRGIDQKISVTKDTLTYLKTDVKNTFVFEKGTPVDEKKGKEILDILSTVDKKLLRYYCGLYHWIGDVIYLFQTKVLFASLGISLVIKNESVSFYKGEEKLVFTIDQLESENTRISLEELLMWPKKLTLRTKNKKEEFTLRTEQFENDVVSIWYLTRHREYGGTTHQISLPSSVNIKSGYNSVTLSIGEMTERGFKASKTLEIFADGKVEYIDNRLNNDALKDLAVMRSFFTKFDYRVIDYYCMLFPWFNKAYQSLTNQKKVEPITREKKKQMDNATTMVLTSLGFDPKDLIPTINEKTIGYPFETYQVVECPGPKRMVTYESPDGRIVGASCFRFFDKDSLSYREKRADNSSLSVSLEWFATPKGEFFPGVHICQSESDKNIHIRFDLNKIISIMIENKSPNGKRIISQVSQMISEKYTQTKPTLTAAEISQILEKLLNNEAVIKLLNYYEEYFQPIQLSRTIRTLLYDLGGLGIYIKKEHDYLCVNLADGIVMTPETVGFIRKKEQLIDIKSIYEKQGFCVEKTSGDGKTIKKITIDFFDPKSNLNRLMMSKYQYVDQEKTITAEFISSEKPYIHITYEGNVGTTASKVYLDGTVEKDEDFQLPKNIAESCCPPALADVVEGEDYIKPLIEPFLEYYRSQSYLVDYMLRVAKNDKGVAIVYSQQ